VARRRFTSRTLRPSREAARTKSRVKRGRLWSDATRAIQPARAKFCCGTRNAQRLDNGYAKYDDEGRLALSHYSNNGYRKSGLVQRPSKPGGRISRPAGGGGSSGRSMPSRSVGPSGFLGWPVADPAKSLSVPPSVPFAHPRDPDAPVTSGLGSTLTGPRSCSNPIGASRVRHPESTNGDCHAASKEGRHSGQ
jgi:hypothetical protein